MNTIKYIWILKTYLWHVSLLVYHLQGAQYARFKIHCPRQTIIYKIPQSLVGSTVDVSYVWQVKLVQFFKKLMVKIWLAHFLHSKCDFYDVKLLLLQLVVEASSLWHCMFRYIGIVTRYGLDNRGIKFRWGMRFPAPVQTDPRAHPASYTTGTLSFLGAEVAEAWHWPPTPI
jgi:hypothetical protein